MNDLVFQFFGFEMRNVQRSDGIERAPQDVGVHAPLPEIASHLPECTQHPRTVEPLALTVLAETHR